MRKIELQYQSEPALQALVDNIISTIKVMCVLSDIFDEELLTIVCVNTNGIVELVYRLVTLWSDGYGSCCICDCFFSWDDFDQLTQKINEHSLCET